MFIESKGSYGGNSEKLIQVVDLADAQQIYEELVTPWMQVARKSQEFYNDKQVQTYQSSQYYFL